MTGHVIHTLLCPTLSHRTLPYHTLLTSTQHNKTENSTAHHIMVYLVTEPIIQRKRKRKAKEEFSNLVRVKERDGRAVFSVTPRTYFISR